MGSLFVSMPFLRLIFTRLSHGTFQVFFSLFLGNYCRGFSWNSDRVYLDFWEVLYVFKVYVFIIQLIIFKFVRRRKKSIYFSFSGLKGCLFPGSRDLFSTVFFLFFSLGLS